MQNFKAVKGSGLKYILMETVLYNLLMIVLLFLIDNYELSILIKISLVIVNVRQLHYVLLNSALVYSIDKDSIYVKNILGITEKRIFFKDIKAYAKASGMIKGVKLYGYGKNHFALGKSIVDKIGITKMYVTSNENIMYINTEYMNYGISPEKFHDFEALMNERNVKFGQWEYKPTKNTDFYKDKKFIIPIVITTIIIAILTLNPFILYLYHKLPQKMPLSFDASFKPLKIGLGKQFAFKQMSYGVLNMALLFCMYYASYFWAKYDKRSAYKFIYVSMSVSALFLIIQFRILCGF